MADEKGGVLVVDVDGTLCETKSPEESYADLVPRRAMVEKLHEYRAKGYTIQLFTSRNMRTYGNNLGLINKFTAPVLIEWLDKWAIPYDEILFGKPWAMGKGFYVDDKAVRPDEFLRLSEAEIHELLGNSP